MFTRIIQCLVLGCVAVASCSALAAEGDDWAEQRQKFREMREQVLQNMQQQGVDPQQFFGEMGRQMAEGKFDLGSFQKKMIESGLIDKDSVEKLNASTQNAALGGIRRQLGVTDDAEWAVLQPKIQRVVSARSEADSGNQFGGMLSGFSGGQPSKFEVGKKRQDLKAALDNAQTTANEYQIKVDALRDAGRKAKEELSAAQKDLVEVVTARQEATLVLLGLLN